MKKIMSEILILTFGSVLFAFGIYFFRMPNNFVVGGASGLAIIFSKMFPLLTKGQFVTIINIICVVIGLVFFRRAIQLENNLLFSPIFHSNNYTGTNNGY